LASLSKGNKKYSVFELGIGCIPVILALGRFRLHSETLSQERKRKKIKMERKKRNILLLVFFPFPELVVSQGRYLGVL
jgi:hypothetical protein